MRRLFAVLVALALMPIGVLGQGFGSIHLKSLTIHLNENVALQDRDHDQLCVPENVVPETTPIPTIHDAAKAGNLKRVRELLVQDPTLSGSLDREGLTPIFWAAEKGQMAIVDLLLSQGRSVNEKTSEGFTPLASAIARCQKSMVHFLVSKGADVNVVYGNGLTALIFAVDVNFPEGLALLVTKGAGINRRNDTGLTLLQLAADKGHTRIVRFLLAEGADVNIADDAGYTPLFEAVKNGYKDIVQLLLANGANVNARNIFTDTPLHLAAHNDRDEIARILIAKGAHVNAKDENGITPCGVARDRGGTKDCCAPLLTLSKHHRLSKKSTGKSCRRGTCISNEDRVNVNRQRIFRVLTCRRVKSPACCNQTRCTAGERGVKPCFGGESVLSARTRPGPPNLLITRAAAPQTGSLGQGVLAVAS